jgi:hypothetical protein
MALKPEIEQPDGRKERPEETIAEEDSEGEELGTLKPITDTGAQ